MVREKIFFKLISLAGLSLLWAPYSTPMTQQSPAEVEKSQPPSQAKTRPETDNRTEPPVACNITALNAAQRKRVHTLLTRLRKAKEEVREIDNGYALRFPLESAIIQDLAEYITLERLCCPFFTFEMEVVSDGGPVWLRLTGREGVKKFIRTELGM